MSSCGATNAKPWAACPERDRADALGVIEECAKAAWCNGHQGAARAIRSARDRLEELESVVFTNAGEENA